jgi:ATP-dependent Clp protease protease subunit
VAKLKINSDIISENSRQFMQLFFGIDSGVSYDSVESFLESIPDDDGVIDISIHCNGGEVTEGWSIYDKLRASGKEISATIEGKCASMASILLLAAPKERRYGRPNASLLIHEPYLPFIDGHLTAGELNRLSGEMKQETDKIVNVYVERTGADEETLRALMKEDKHIDMNKAIELGFISKTIAPTTAKANNFNHNSKMADEVKVSKSFLEKVLAKLGYSKVEDAERGLTAVAMELTTEEGSTLTVERESGDPQVGDKASPDGTIPPI